MVTPGKKNDLHARRRALGFVREKDAVGKLFGVLAERYSKRDGGYTRVVRTRNREKDAAPMAFIEFVDRPGELRKAREPSAVPPPPEQPNKRVSLYHGYVPEHWQEEMVYKPSDKPLRDTVQSERKQGKKKQVRKHKNPTRQRAKEKKRRLARLKKK
eukprot:TRINITY_DN57196_c0_g1_i1.p2 TRINITY_DN57196_c0_g1~~TRINITY_DN57196_c0_g1_i1.p2  ORF type:complete len:157 (-),score=82.38 TRINITY_DN57196_c0_g1_i1:57-527(-)